MTGPLMKPLDEVYPDGLVQKDKELYEIMEEAKK